LKTKLPVNIASLTMIYGLLYLPLLVTGSFTLSNSIILLAAVFAFYYLGAALLSAANVVNLLLPLSWSALSVFTGALVFSLFIFISPNLLFLIISLLSVAILLLLFYRKQTTWAFNLGKADLMTFVISLIMIAIVSAGDDLHYQFAAQQSGGNCCAPDIYFFNSVVASLRHGTIYSAVYEINSSNNYQVLGFLIPALFADLLSLSSHQALWGLALPFYKLLVFLFSYELCYYYLRDKVSRNNYLFILMAASLPVLLAPLHPLYIFKGDVGKFIFNGMGYLVPAGTITFPVGIFLMLLNLFFFSKTDWKNPKFTGDKLFFIFSLSLIIIGKEPVYVSYYFFMGAVMLKRIVFDKERVLNYAGYLIISTVLSYILFKVCMGQQAGALTYFKYGYLEERFAAWFGRGTKGGANNMIIILLILFSYLLWLGLRLLGLLALVKSKVPSLIDFFIGGVCSLACASVLCSFLRIASIDTNGKIILDITFNSEGFVRSSFYILTVISAIGLLYLLFGKQLKRKTLNLLFAITAAWCLLSLSSLMYTAKSYAATCKPLTWYTDNLDQLKTGRYNDGLIVVNPGFAYFGIMLASSDYGKYWSAMDRSEANYNCTTKNQYRWILYKNLLNAPEEKYLLQMKNEGVKYVIATPYDSAAVSAVERLFPQHIHKLKDATWIYQLE
jgi:hypothetical protein